MSETIPVFGLMLCDKNTSTIIIYLNDLATFEPI